MLAVVPKPTKTAKPTKAASVEPGHTQTAFRLPNELLDQIDAVVEQANQARQWPKMTRSDLVRLVLTRVMTERPDWLVSIEGK